MKVLILVLSAMRDPWGELLLVSKDTWDAEVHPQTQTLYYVGAAEHHQLRDTFYSPSLSESLEDIAGRTIEAFEKSLELEWDFMARTHSSTYVHKRNLVDFCETLHRKNLLCGLLTMGLEPFLWGGGSYIISRDVIEQFVANKDKWDLSIMEDGSITNLARELGIPFTKGRMASIDHVADHYLVTTYGVGEGFEFTDWADVKKLHPHYYVRCKQDLRRHEDIDIFRALKTHYV